MKTLSSLQQRDIHWCKNCLQYDYNVFLRSYRILINKEITLHSFRHTHTSLLIEPGVGLKEIQQRLGHTDIQTTMNIYTHMTDNMEEKASPH
ncbi:tyrosine-type recombinase/integrase [[Brevibacterium] frigoritolerans]|uniref:Tyrosine-type recombinase/integrase n=1 Tax=Peribacillus frigoritolerans TaxID=450367 RepID=A0A941FJZ1_9BACI|nr:tyrosine-type recombinase/integrase [Peribacillus frigoritolerans]